MPWIDLKCAKCGHKFDLTLRFADVPSTGSITNFDSEVACCPECGNTELKRLVDSTPPGRNASWGYWDCR